MCVIIVLFVIIIVIISFLYLLIFPVHKFLIGACANYNVPIIPMTEFPEHTTLKDNWRRIAHEAYSAAYHAKDASDVSKTAFGNLNKEKKWSLFMLTFYGENNEENMKLCPITTELIKSIPRIKLAMFSILEPNMRIPIHRGIFKGCMRYHLALQVPRDRDNCFINIGSQQYNWELGEDVLFDDTYDHFVVNNTNERRIVLFLDVERDIKGLVGKLNHAIIESPLPKWYFNLNSKNEKAQETG